MTAVTGGAGAGGGIGCARLRITSQRGSASPRTIVKGSPPSSRSPSRRAVIARPKPGGRGVLRSGTEDIVAKERTMPDPVIEPEVEEPTPVEEAPEDLVEEDLLVEDVSIDGMCGVY